MLHLTTHTQVLIAIQPADFRCGIDGLAALCKQRLSQDPRSHSLFVFINRNRTMVRVLGYDGSGFWLMTKRLSKGRFQNWPRHHQDNVTAIVAKQLKSLLTGQSNWYKL